MLIRVSSNPGARAPASGSSTNGTGINWDVYLHLGVRLLEERSAVGVFSVILGICQLMRKHKTSPRVKTWEFCDI